MLGKATHSHNKSQRLKQLQACSHHILETWNQHEKHVFGVNFSKINVSHTCFKICYLLQILFFQRELNLVCYPNLQRFIYTSIFTSTIFFIIIYIADILLQKNERMLHRLHSVSKILKQYKKERKFLMHRLDQHGDNYREAPAALPYETQEVIF